MGDPFNSSEADIILRSADNLDIKFHKWLLSFASPVFKDMFTLSESSSSSSGKVNSDFVDGLPVVAMSEKSSILQALLELLHPVWLKKDGSIQSLEMWSEVLEAAEKYQMDGVKPYLFEILESFLEKKPFPVFALAMVHKLGIAQKAAKGTLSTPFENWKWFPEAEFITGGDLLKLQAYHLKCKRFARLCASDSSRAKRISKMVLSLSGTNVTAWAQVCICTKSSAESYNWWSQYTAEISPRFHACPQGSTVRNDTEAFCRSLLTASNCVNCRTIAPTVMEICRRDLASEIDYGIDKIVLETGFQTENVELRVGSKCNFGQW